MKVKLMTDNIIGSNFVGSDFNSPTAFSENKMNQLIALVYFHRMEQIRRIEVVIDEYGDAYSAEFDCYFSPEQYEID